MGDSIPTTELCDRFEETYTEAIADVLDDRGYEDQTLRSDIGPVVDGVSMAGTAYPIVGRPNRSVDPEETTERLLELLGKVPPDAVQIYETNDPVGAHVGELTATTLQERGCRGVVVDGGARDVSYTRRLGFPVFSRHVTPADAIQQWEVIDWNATTVVGGVRVEPGDVVVGDPDGVVVVPADDAAEVLVEVESRVDDESQVRTALEQGDDPLDLYREYEAF